jgi:hypothetical protein
MTGARNPESKQGFGADALAPLTQGHLIFGYNIIIINLKQASITTRICAFPNRKPSAWVHKMIN